jgi:hypothetical protein
MELVSVWCGACLHPTSRTIRLRCNAVSVSVNLTNDRQNKIVCVFKLKSSRIAAYEIHEWIHENLRIFPHDILMLQSDIKKRHGYINFRDRRSMQTILLATAGQMHYKLSNGEISTVHIEAVRIRKTWILVANLPPEIPENVLRCSPAKYGEFHEITNETCANKYRFQCSIEYELPRSSFHHTYHHTS